jgi:hypothetical protein
MDQAINVKKIEALEELKNTFDRFRNETREVLDCTERIHIRILNQLQQEEVLAQNCENSFWGMHHQPFGLTYPKVASEKARLYQVRKCRAKVEKEIQEYQAAAFQMDKILEQEAIKATLMLQRKIDELENYIGASTITDGMEQTFENLQPAPSKLLPCLLDQVKPREEQGRNITDVIAEIGASFGKNTEGDVRHGNAKFTTRKNEKRMAQASNPMERNRSFVE